MEVQNLQFFDYNGYNLNFEWNDSGYWEGSIYLPKVSVGLYANTTIYILEKIDGSTLTNPLDNNVVELDNVNYNQFNDTYVFPRAKKTGDKIIFRWDDLNKFVDEFFMFTFDDTYTLKDTSSLVYTPNDGPDCETLIVNRFEEYEIPLESNYASKALPIHIAFMANEKYDATTYNRILYMYYNKQVVAAIKFFAETVEEDERLKIWNQNLGYNITPEDEMIFYKSDIKEYKPNYILLNEKRKELMMEGSNIYPYIGSYKAIINAIKFFGYENLNIIEYWRNVNPNDENFGKIYHSSKYSLTHQETLTIGARNIVLPNKDYKKINSLALVYSINEPTGEVDQWELPKVKEKFTYTLEEALIKLFALRTKLNKEFMPGSSKIIDIIGEASYFGLHALSKIHDSDSILESSVYVKPEFEVYPSKYVHITDNTYFARYINLKQNGDTTPIQNQILSDMEGLTLEEISNSQTNSTILDDLYHLPNSEKCEWYQRYYQEAFVNHTIYKSIGDNDAYSYDNEEYDYPTEFDTVNDVMMRFAAKVVLTNTTYKPITFGDCELNFDCKNKPLIKDSNNKWSFGETEQLNIQFNSGDASSIDNYHISNHTIKWTIRMSKPDEGIYQYDDELKNVGIIKKYKYHSDDEVAVELSPLPIVIEGSILEKSQVYVQLPYIGYYDVTMELFDGNHNKYKELTTKRCIKVEPYEIEIKGFYYDIREIPKELQYEQDDTMKNFIQETATKMYQYAASERSGNEDLDASVPINGNPGPYSTANLTNGWDLASNLTYEMSSLQPLLKYTRYIKSGVNVKPYTWFLLGYEYSKIAGKKNPHWTIINNSITKADNTVIPTAIRDFENKKYLIFLLKKEGNYTVTLELEDWLGNKYLISRNILVVNNAANYDIYQTFKNDYDFMTKQEFLNELNEFNEYMLEDGDIV